MRFLVDECTGPAVAAWLRVEGHDVFSVYEEARGTDDTTIIEKAYAENRILITNDKDYGEKVYREQHPHHGVVFLRLENERSFVKIETLRRLLAAHVDQLPGQFDSELRRRAFGSPAPTRWRAQSDSEPNATASTCIPEGGVGSALPRQCFAGLVPTQYPPNSAVKGNS